MPQQYNTQKPYTEGDLQLAILNISSQQVRSEKHAAELYTVPRTTLRRRRAGQRPRRDCEPNSKRLSKLEEEVIATCIIKDSLCGWALTKAYVQDIANNLLKEQGGKPISKN